MRLSRPTTRSAPRSRSPHAGYGPVKAERLSQAQSIPLRFLEHIVLDLKHAGIVASQRGAEGGYWLARGSAEVTLAAIIRGVEGPLVSRLAKLSARPEPRASPDGGSKFKLHLTLEIAYTPGDGSDAEGDRGAPPPAHPFAGARRRAVGG